MNFKMLIKLVLVVIFVFSFQLPSFALDDVEYVEGGQNWDLMFGFGGIAVPGYNGSNRLKVFPIPYIDVSYRTKYLEYFANCEDGAGVSKKISKSIPINVSAGINIGEDARKSNDFIILEGTPDVTNNYSLFGKISSIVAPGKFSTKVSYFPISLHYINSEMQDKKYNGLLGSFDWEDDIISGRFLFNLGFGFSVMNKNYAKANYSVETPTPKLKAFNADDGVRDIHASVNIVRLFDQKKGAVFVAEAAYLTGDAGKSPIVSQKVQPFIGLFVFYVL